jgi:hypothetical protein
VPPNPKPERINPQHLDRPTLRGTYLQPGSTLDENPGSDLNGNQQEHGITAVIVNFDGYGDSGQIEDITAQTGAVTVELPDERIEIFRPAWDSADIERETHTVREAIEALCYDFLSQTHGGWENNDGAYGDFTFDVTEGSITLDYNERYTASENYSHEF